MTKQSAGTARRARFAGFQQQLIVALCGAAFATAFSSHCVAQQVTYYDFNGPEAASPSQTSTTCPSSSAPSNILFCFNAFTGSAGLSFIQDSYPPSIDPSASTDGNLGSTNYALQLTEAAGSQDSSVWYSTPLNVADGFNLWYAVKLNYQYAPPNYFTADGLAFVIQNAAGGGTDSITNCSETGSGLNVLGGGGGGIGYCGIDNSVALEMDTFYDAPYDPDDGVTYFPDDLYDDNHMALQSCLAGNPNSVAHLGTPNCLITLNGTSTLVSNPYTSAASPASPSAVILADGNPHQIVMVYNGPNDSPANYLYVYLDAALNPGTHTPVAGSAPLFSGPFNIANYINLSNGAAYIGFTAANGGDFEQHELMGFSFTPHNFGNANVCPAGATAPSPCSNTFPVTVNVAAGTAIGSVQVVTQGTTGLDFSLNSAGSCTGTTSGSSCTVNVTFTPEASGLRTGAVELLLSGGTTVASQLIYGIGQAPVAALSQIPPNVNLNTLYSGLNHPQGAAVDAAGNVYIADNGNNQVLKVAPNNGPATILANGNGGSYALVNLPESVAVDGAGDVFIGQNAGSVVEIPAGCTSPLSSCQQNLGALQTATSVALDAAGDVFVGDQNAGKIVELPVGNFSTQNVVYPPQNGFVPGGMAVDVGGDVFVTDTHNEQVLEIPAGGGTPIQVGIGWVSPQSVALDAAGDVYVADPGLNSGSGGIVEVPAGCTGVNASECEIGLVTGTTVYGFALDPLGDIYLLDFNSGYLDEAPQSPGISLSFPALNVGTACCATLVTLQNIGNQTLNAVNPGLVINPNWDMSSGEGYCSSVFSLVPGADCDQTIGFAPEVVGPAPNGTLYGSANFYDNALNNPASAQSIFLTGNSSAGTGPMFTLTVTEAGAGSGSVVDNLTAISCSYSSPNTTGTCSGSYEAGVPVTLTASAGNGSTFVSWGGACAGSGSNPTCVVTMSQALNVSASFAPRADFATANVCPSGTGTGCTASMRVIVNFPANGNLYVQPSQTTVLADGNFGPFLDFVLTQGGDGCTSEIVSAPGSCMVDVTFQPQGPGLRLGAVVVQTAYGTVTQPIYGIGQAPEIAFGPAETYTVPTSAQGNITFSSQVTGLSNPFFGPAGGMTTDEAGNLYMVGETASSTGELMEFAPPNTGSATRVATGFNAPVSVAIDGAGNLYVADSGLNSPNGEVVELAPGCNAVSCGTAVYAPTMHPSPAGVAVDGPGDVFIADTLEGVIEIPAGCSGSNCWITVYSGASGSKPEGVAVDAAGDIFVADQGLAQVVEIPAGCTSAGCQIQVGSGWIDPRGVAVDPAGDVIVADFEYTVDGEGHAGALEEVPAGCTSSGCQITLFTAGSPDPAYVTVSGTGQLFVATDGPVYEIDQSQPPAVSFGTTNDGLEIGPDAVTVQNIGNQALAGSVGALSAGINFAELSSTCTSFSLTPGTTCNENFEFEPQSGVVGQVGDSATVTDNSLNGSPATQNIPVSGYGVPVTGASNTLGVNLLGSGSGTVTDGASLNCSAANPAGCSTTYPTSTVSVTLTETPTAGSAFIGWSGGCASAGSNPQCIVTMTAITNVTANFTLESAGPVNVCSAGIVSGCTGSTFPVTFNIAANTTIGVTQVVTQGVTGLDFTPGSGGTCTGTFPTANTCNVNVNFTPLAPGLRTGAVELYASNGSLIATQPVYGIGQGPEGAFSPGTQTAAATASFNGGVVGLAVDAAGDVYFPSGAQAVLKVAPGGAQTTIAATGVGNPYDVAVDGSGNVIISDIANFPGQVVSVPYLGNGIYGTPTVVATPGIPYGVAVDGQNNVYIVDSEVDSLVKVPYLGNGTYGPESTIWTFNFNTSNPYDVAVDATGNLFVSDPGTPPQVWEIPYLGNGNYGAASSVLSTGLACPYGVAVDAADDVYIADWCNSDLVEVPYIGNGNFGAATTVVQDSNGPFGLAVDAAGDLFYGNQDAPRVTEVQRSQAPALNFALSAEGTASAPQSVALQNVGNQPLTGTLTPVSTTNFLENTGCTTFTLAPGGTCLQSFSFTPTTTGYLTDAAYFSDNTLNLASSVVSQAVNLTGIADIAGQSATLIVPNVVGMAQSAATSALTGAGLALGSVSSAYSSGEPAGSVIGENPAAGTPENPGSAVSLLISIGEAPPPSPNPLTFENNYFVTGDYASAGVTLHGATIVNGMATSSITIPDSTTTPSAAQGVPDGADIIDGFLYWETLENTATASGGNATFLGYPISGSQIGSDIPNYTDGALTGTLRAYRADVNTYFPIGANGERFASGSFSVAVPSGGNALPVAEGASLVVIYRVLVAPGSTSVPSMPLKSVVIYDGSTVSTGTTQNVLGFYDSAGPGESTALYYAGGSWNNSSSSVTVGSGASQYPAPLNSGNAYVAEILSTPVMNSDNDGILDSWKAGPPSGDFFYKQPGYYEVKTQSWVPLPGAKTGQQDLFVQLDWMCGAVLSNGACDPTQENLYPSPDSNGNDPLAMVQKAFLSTVTNPVTGDGIHLHLEIGNAVPETTCTDSNSQLCQFPGEPGVIGWKNSLEFSKIWPRNFTSCASGGDCTARFPYGQKDSYHYVLFGHSLAIPAWNSRYGSLTSITVSGATTTITTTDRGTGINACPSRITISGVLSNPGLNGIYNTSSCPDTMTMIVATPSGIVNPWSYSYATNTPSEPVIGITSGTVTSISGYSDLGGADSAVTLALWETAPNQDMSKRAQVIAGTLFHEIGHTLGLSHGGLYYKSAPSYIPNFDVNCKPNYQSVMNYLYQLDGLGPNGAVAFSNQTLDAESNQTIGVLNANSLASVTSLTDASGNPATFPTSAWYVDPFPGGATTASPATLHCDGTPLGGDSGYRVDGSIDGSVAGSPGWTNGENIAFDGVSYGALAGYNDVNNIDLRQVGATGGEFASLASVLSFGSSATPLNVTAGGSVSLGAGGTVALGSGGTVTVGSNANVTLGSSGTITSGGSVTLNNGGSAMLSTGGTVTMGSSGGTITLEGTGGNVTLGSGGTVTYGNAMGSVGLPSGGTVTLGSGGMITSDAGTVSIPSTGGTYTIDGNGGTITLGSGGNVTLGSGGNVTLGSGGTIALGSGGNVTLGSGGNVTLGSGGTIALGSGGTIALGSGGNVTLGSGGTIALGSGGNVTLGSGGNVTLGSGGNVTLGSGGNVTLGSGGNVTLGSGGTIALGSGGNVTLGSGGNITLGSGGTIVLGSGGTVTNSGGTVLAPSSGGTYTVSAGTYTLSSGGNVTLGSGGNITLGSGGNVTLGSGGVIALGSGGNVTLGSGGTIALGSGGNITLGSGGVTTNEMDYATANSVVRPPPSATYTQSSNSITVNWMPPAFGVVQSYTVYRSVNGATPSVIGNVGGVNGNPPATAFTDMNPQGGTLVYTITTALVPDTNGSRNSLPSPPAVLTLNQTIVLGSLPGTVQLPGPQTVTATAMTNNNANGLLVSFSASGPCSVGSSSLNAQTFVSSASITLSDTGNCTITASQAGDIGSSQAGQTPFNAAQPVSATFAIVAQNSNATPQTINFPSLPNVPYGSTFTPNASSNFGQQITYTTTGLCNANGTISGIGPCTIKASAPASAPGANPSYSSVSMSQSFTVYQAVLTVTAGNLTSNYGQIPSLASDYNVTGYVNSETSSVLSGAPALSTTATSTSVPAIYPINISAGTLTATNYSFQFVPGTLTISLAAPTISISNLPTNAMYGGNYTAAYTYAGNGTPSVSSSTTSVCTASGSSVSFVGVGQCTLTASATATTNYAMAAGTAQSFTVGKATPTIGISNLPSNAMYGGNYTAAYTYAGNGTPSVSSSTTSICTASGSSVSFVGVGQCTLTASATATTDYATATGSAQSFMVGKTTPTISISNLPANAIFGGNYTAAYTYAGNGTPSVSSSTTSICTASGSSVSFVGVGQCTLTASATATTDYAMATGSAQSFTVGQASQTITLTTPASAAYGSQFTATATASSGLAVTLTSAGGCTNSATTLTSGAYTSTYTMTSSTTACSVIATAASNADYTSATVTKMVSSSGPVITVSPLSLTFGPVAVGSITTQTVTVSNTGSAAATISTPLLSLLQASSSNEYVIVNLCPSSLAAGKSCTITVSFVAGAYYSGPQTAILKVMDNAPNSPQQVSLSATILEPQTITFTSVPSSAVYNSKFTVTATGGGSGNPVTFTASGACSVGPGTATFTMTSGTGSCSVIANQAGNSIWAAASQVTKSVSATLATPAISISNLPASAAYGSSYTAAYNYTGNGTPSVTSSTTSVCTASGSSVSLVGVGTCTLKASAPATTNYAAVTGSAQSFTVGKAAQTIALTNVPSSAAYKSTFTVTAKASSGLAVAYTSSGSCSNSGATYTMTSGTGTCSVIANQAGNSDYTAAPQVSEGVTATVATQAITFTTKAPATAAYKTSFTVAATGGASGNAVTFTSSGSCTNSGTTYTMTSGTGTCSVIANQAGITNEYTAAPAVTESVTAAYSAATLTPTSLSFGTVASGKSSSAQTATLTNTGSTPLIISGIGFTGTNPSSFTETNTCPSSSSSLAAGAKCAIAVTFKSGGTAVTANLTVTDNTSAGTQNVSLSGK